MAITSKAYTYFIDAHGYGLGEMPADGQQYGLVNQSSPAWVLTFIRWNVRDTIRTISPVPNSPSLLAIRRPLVVENDCIQLSVNVNKSVLTHSIQATLVETDVNYETAIAPGDFVFVNILNWDKDARRIVNIASSQELDAINGFEDGFKGFFKVQSVRKTVQIIDNIGTKRVLYQITAFAFTEFNNCIYFNPYVARDNQGTAKDNLVFASNLAADYAQLMSADANNGTGPNVRDIIKALIESFVGKGVSDRGATSISLPTPYSGANFIPIAANTHFYMPQQVGTLLGLQNVAAAKDVYNYLFGIQQYSGGSASVAPQVGFWPSNAPTTSDNRFYFTDQPTVGSTLLKAEYWNQHIAWSILNQYTNAPLNEFFTCFRLDGEGFVMPTVVLRQIPFTSEFYGNPPFNTTANVTKFLSLPRWSIAPSLVIATDLGRDEAARVNFVQYYAQPPSEVEKHDGYMSVQTASQNYAYDINDVSRSGLRPIVVTTSFEDLTVRTDVLIGRKCALIYGDAVMGEHLKMNGSVECVGISQPIAVGDNFEYEGVVYHIEEISHLCSVNIQGIRSFRSVLKLSHGTSIVQGQTYPEMVYGSGYQDRKNNYSHTQTLPGVSEEQAVTYRPNSTAPTQSEIDRITAPFIQPGQTVNTQGENDE
jgi:hypothetical protein